MDTKNLIDILHIRSHLGRKIWGVPHPLGVDSWKLVRFDGTGSVIVSVWPPPDGADGGRLWLHASMAVFPGLPTYEQMCELHQAVWGTDGYAYQVHAPSADHINIKEVLHLWGRADGSRVLPDFAIFGTI